MVVECIAILAVIAAICFIYLRAGKREYAHVIVPLLLLPGVHLLMELFAKRALIGVEFGNILWVLADALAMGITYLLIGRLSRYIEGRGQRTGIMAVTCLYSVILTAIFIFDILGG